MFHPIYHIYLSTNSIIYSGNLQPMKWKMKSKKLLKNTHVQLDLFVGLSMGELAEMVSQISGKMKTKDESH